MLGINVRSPPFLLWPPPPNPTCPYNWPAPANFLEAHFVLTSTGRMRESRQGWAARVATGLGRESRQGWAARVATGLGRESRQDRVGPRVVTGLGRESRDRVGPRRRCGTPGPFPPPLGCPKAGAKGGGTTAAPADPDAPTRPPLPPNPPNPCVPRRAAPRATYIAASDGGHAYSTWPCG
eukprot:19370-Chlamydomonas_euryale.AAC.3